MNEQAQDRIHAIRNSLLILKGQVHMHMQGDTRFAAERELDIISQKVNEIWHICLTCTQGEKDEGS